MIVIWSTGLSETAPLEDPDLVPAGLHVVVLDGEHHEEHEEEPHRREEVPEVVVVEDQHDALRVEVRVGYFGTIGQPPIIV